MGFKNRKMAALALGIVGVAGLSLASAAQLNLTTASLGAGTEVVASCDETGIGVTFVNAYSVTGYQTTDVTLTGVDAGCNGLDLRITVADAAGASLGEITGVTAATGAASYTLPAAVDASLVENVSVVISG